MDKKLPATTDDDEKKLPAKTTTATAHGKSGVDSGDETAQNNTTSSTDITKEDVLQSILNGDSLPVHIDDIKCCLDRIRNILRNNNVPPIVFLEAHAELIIMFSKARGVKDAVLKAEMKGQEEKTRALQDEKEGEIKPIDHIKDKAINRIVSEKNKEINRIINEKDKEIDKMIKQIVDNKDKEIDRIVSEKDKAIEALEKALEEARDNITSHDILRLQFPGGIFCPEFDPAVREAIISRNVRPRMK